MTHIKNDRIIRRASRMASTLRKQLREATSRNTFGPARVSQADALWPSDFWQDHRA